MASLVFYNSPVFSVRFPLASAYTALDSGEASHLSKEYPPRPSPSRIPMKLSKNSFMLFFPSRQLLGLRCLYVTALVLLLSLYHPSCASWGSQRVICTSVFSGRQFSYLSLLFQRQAASCFRQISGTIATPATEQPRWVCRCLLIFTSRGNPFISRQSLVFKIIFWLQFQNGYSRYQNLQVDCLSAFLQSQIESSPKIVDISHRMGEVTQKKM